MNEIATQSLEGEEVNNLTAGDKSATVLFFPRASLQYHKHQERMSD
jgi:hypothetical protein